MQWRALRGPAREFEWAPQHYPLKCSFKYKTSGKSCKQPPPPPHRRSDTKPVELTKLFRRPTNTRGQQLLGRGQPQPTQETKENENVFFYLSPEYSLCQVMVQVVEHKEVVYNANINAIGLENLLVLLIYYPILAYNLLGGIYHFTITTPLLGKSS